MSVSVGGVCSGVGVAPRALPCVKQLLINRKCSPKVQEVNALLEYVKHVKHGATKTRKPGATHHEHCPPQGPCTLASSQVRERENGKTRSNTTDKIVTLSYPAYLRQRLARTHPTYQDNRIHEAHIPRANPTNRQRRNTATKGITHAAEPLQAPRESSRIRFRNARPSQHRYRRSPSS